MTNILRDPFEQGELLKTLKNLHLLPWPEKVSQTVDLAEIADGDQLINPELGSIQSEQQASQVTHKKDGERLSQGRRSELWRENGGKV